MIDINALDKLIGIHEEVSSHLSKCLSDDQAYEVSVYALMP